MSLPDHRDIAAEERLLNEPLYRDLRPATAGVEFVERLQRAIDTEDWVYLPPRTS